MSEQARESSVGSTVCEGCEKPTFEPLYSDEGDAFCGACALSMATAAFDRLTELVAGKASLVPGDTGHPYNTGAEHKVWALWGPWRAGGADLDDARDALRVVIREEILS